MATTSKTKVRNAMGKSHKTVTELARATHLTEAQVQGALAKLVAEGYTSHEVEGYRRRRH